jgi:uncharacterized membrane protein (UPF0127 family)
MARARTWLLGAALALAACGRSDEPGVQAEQRAEAGLRIAILRVGSLEVEAEIAYREPDRRRGLMFRRELRQDHGMLFVFAEDRQRHFYMLNTWIPLTIAFIDREGRILDLVDMDPDPQGGIGTQAASSGPARYALEMIQGWFDGHGIRVGDPVEIPAWVKALPADPE